MKMLIPRRSGVAIPAVSALKVRSGRGEDVDCVEFIILGSTLPPLEAAAAAGESTK